MSEQTYKRGLHKMNKYQEKIFLLAFIPSTALCLCTTALLYLCFNDFGKALTNQKTMLDLAYVEKWGAIVMVSLWIFFVALLIWVYREAHHLLGAFNRINSELNDVANGDRKSMITVRPKDDLFKELLENINLIIKKLYG